MTTDLPWSGIPAHLAGAAVGVWKAGPSGWR